VTASPALRTPEDGESASAELAYFLAAIDAADRTLAAQRETMAALGFEIVPTDSATRSLAPSAILKRNSGEERTRLLALTLEEIQSRQRQINDAVRPHDAGFEDIALDALVNAMHRIRTCLDVALGCSEEISEITADEDVASAARESARALRLVYQYTHELNDIAALPETIGDRAPEAYLCATVLERAVNSLARIAVDASVNLHATQNTSGDVAIGDSKLLERALNYLILTTIVSPGVSEIRCAVDYVRTYRTDRRRRRLCGCAETCASARRAHRA